MALVAQITQQGGPEVIEWIDKDLPAPGPGEVRMRNTAIGLNFIDTYHRGGVYPVPLPSGLGVEAAGIVDAVGDGVTGFAPGDRVATFGPVLGSYATERNIAAAALFKTPDGIADEVAAAAMLKGCTAEFLVERCAKVQPGWTVLVHAAAGGVGLLLVQWLKHMGARVIGTVGTTEKADLARAAGADHVIITTEEDTAKACRDLTEGKGVPVVFDGVGQDSWDASLRSTAPRGLIVSYGNASGPVTGVDLRRLAEAGSIFVTRPTLFHYYATPEERAAGAARLFEMLGTGAVTVDIRQRYALTDAAQAHRDLEARRTTGSSLLLP
ncbi:MAG: quinone oxidoreductase family protein [Chakrabartia sp.]